MKKALTIFLTLLLQGAWPTGCASDAELVGELPRAERSLGDISKFISAVAVADEITVYEGLPHPSWEASYVTEVKRPDLVWFEGYPFYGKPLSLPETEKKALATIAQDKEAHVPHWLDAFCGGFHPDYVVIWTKDEKSGALICFGCHEWKNFTPAGRLREDLSPAAYEQLRGILSKYVVQRPKAQRADQTLEPQP